MKLPVIVLFEYTGLSAAAWAEAGHQVYCYDNQHKGHTTEGNTHKVYWDANDGLTSILEEHSGGAAMVLCFAPCDDLAASGSRHFELKLSRDPYCQYRAVERLRMGEELGTKLGCPWVCENPVGRASTLWRRPDVYVHPWMFGGYLPEDDVHPLYPDYIKPRDAYPKNTGLWFGNGFQMPAKKPVAVRPGYSDQHLKLGGKSLKTKNIRSASPRGLMRGIYEANC